MSANVIQTYSRILIDPLDPKPEQISIEDIAHSLANQCRFTGHTRSPALFGRDLYTTAEHCVHVAELTPAPYKLHALLHDAGEAYMSDIASPVKRSLNLIAYRKIEKNLQRVVYESFGIGADEPPEVKTADTYMLGIEARDLMRGLEGDHWREVVAPVLGHGLSVRRPWSPRHAKRRFLSLFKELTNA